MAPSSIVSSMLKARSSARARMTNPKAIAAGAATATICAAR